MRRSLAHFSVSHKGLHNIALIILVLIIVLHGTYFKREISDMSRDVDWLVLARLLTCLIGLIVGIFIIPKNFKWGFGSKVLLFYIIATGISSINSPYPLTVIGYFFILFGASILMIGLVYSANNSTQLEKIEKIWFLTVSVLVLKDAITSLLFPVMPMGGDVMRLGADVTHPNMISLLAGLVFWLSFKNNGAKRSSFLWLFRAILIGVIIGAVSRGSIAAFIVGIIFFILFNKKNKIFHHIKVFAIMGLLLASFLLIIVFEKSWPEKIVDYIKRGQDTTAFTTFTGRTLVWNEILKKSFDSPIIGHGYGLSRFTIGVIPVEFSNPSNSHNDVLEVFFNTGLIGLIPFLFMLLYSLTWIRKYSIMKINISADLAIHAVCIISMILVSSIIDIRLSARVDPIHLLFIYYLIIIDVRINMAR